MKSKKTNLELEKLKTMSFKDKGWYIWEYYKIPLLSILGIIFLLVTLVPSVLNQRDPDFTSYIVNHPIADEEYTLIKEEFAIYSGMESSDFWDLDTSIRIDWKNSMSGYEYMAKMTAVISTAGLDVIIGDEATMEHFGKLSGLYDLTEILPEDLQKSQADQFLYITDEEGNSKACALMLVDNPLFKTSGGTNKLYFSIVSNSPHLEKSIQFLQFLLEK